MDRRAFDDVVQRAKRQTWRSPGGSGPVLSIRYPHAIAEGAPEGFEALEHVEATAHALGVPLALTGGGFGCIDFAFSLDGASRGSLDALVEEPRFRAALNDTPATSISIRRTTEPKDYERRGEQLVHLFTNRSQAASGAYGREAVQTVSSAIYGVELSVTEARQASAKDIWRRTAGALFRGPAMRPAIRLHRTVDPAEAAAAAADDGCVGVLLNIHGISTSLEDGLVGTARLARDLELDKLRLSASLFSWPADGPATDYDSIVRRGENSETPLARTLSALSLTGKPLHVVAHSHGNKVLLRAAVRLKASKMELGPEPGSALLVAADVDHGFMEDNLPDLMSVFRKGVLYFCNRDLALKLAGRKFGAARAGSVGIDTAGLEVESINLDSIVSVASGFGHSYHADTQLVVNDMYYALRGTAAKDRHGLDPGERPGVFFYRRMRVAA